VKERVIEALSYLVLCALAAYVVWGAGAGDRAEEIFVCITGGLFALTGIGIGLEGRQRARTRRRDAARAQAAFLLALRERRPPMPHTTDLVAHAWGDRNGVALDRPVARISPAATAALWWGGIIVAVAVVWGVFLALATGPAPAAQERAAPAAPTATATPVPTLPAAVLNKRYANTVADLELPLDLRDVSGILTQDEWGEWSHSVNTYLTDDALEVAFGTRESLGGFRIRCDTTADSNNFYLKLDLGRADLSWEERARYEYVYCSRRSTTTRIPEGCGIPCALTIPTDVLPSQARIVVYQPD
jgi:hypothetical protein